MAAVVVFVLGPPGPQPVSRSLPPETRSLAGAYHIHTTRSDGALDRDGVARAASRAGLRFAIFTDHGDGTAAPAPPEYLHGVLCLDGVEVSTNDGHYVALGAGQAPYPLGGDADAVAEDVLRLGGWGIVAHPFSARRELAWGDWTLSPGAIEWLNADSEWRDESNTALGRALLGYLWRPAGALASLLDRPVSTLAKWDEMAAGRKVIALPAHDAHGGFGRDGRDSPGRRLHVPSYDATFRSFTARVTLSSAPTGDAAHDAGLLLDAIRAGAVFSAIDAIAVPGTLDYRATAGETSVPMGGTIAAGAGAVTFTVRADAPATASTVLLRNGAVVAEASGGALEYRGNGPGSYRVEVRVDGAPGTPPVPWLVSNPIFWFAHTTPGEVPALPLVGVMPLTQGVWRTELSPGSSGAAAVEEGVVRFRYRLPDGPPSSQFAALVRDLTDAPESTAIAFKARASRPMRMSVQLRFARDGNGRWRKSFYVDGEGRDVVIPIAHMRPADAPGSRPLISRASSLLFVVDLVNAVPGSEGSLEIRDVMLAR